MPQISTRVQLAVSWHGDRLTAPPAKSHHRPTIPCHCRTSTVSSTDSQGLAPNCQLLQTTSVVRLAAAAHDTAGPQDKVAFNNPFHEATNMGFNGSAYRAWPLTRQQQGKFTSAANAGKHCQGCHQPCKTLQGSAQESPASIQDNGTGGASASGFHAEDAEVISNPACQHGSASMVLHSPSSSLMLHTALPGEHAAAAPGHNRQH